MPDYSHPTLGKDEEIVETLLRLPARNLESRVTALEDQIQRRQTIQRDIVLQLDTLKLRLEDRIWQLRYVHFVPQFLAELEAARHQLLHVETLLANEQRDSFRDTVKLHELIQEAREEQKLAEERLKLLQTAEDMATNTENNGTTRRDQRPSKED